MATMHREKGSLHSLNYKPYMPNEAKEFEVWTWIASVA